MNRLSRPGPPLLGPQILHVNVRPEPHVVAQIPTELKLPTLRPGSGQTLGGFREAGGQPICLYSVGDYRWIVKIGCLLTCLVILAKIGTAQAATLTLQEDLSSKLPTGTSFTAKDSAGKVYHGHVVTHPARRLLRRG